MILATDSVLDMDLSTALVVTYEFMQQEMKSGRYWKVDSYAHDEYHTFHLIQFA